LTTSGGRRVHTDARERKQLPRLKLSLFGAHVNAYVISAILVGVATFVCSSAVKLVPEASLSLIYLVAIMISAQLYGLWPAILSSLLGILAWDFFFTKPYFSLNVASERDVFTLIFFMITALTISGMTSQVRRQNAALAMLASKNQNLYHFSKELAQINGVEAIASFASQYIAELLGREVSVILDDRGNPGKSFVFRHNKAKVDVSTDVDLSAAMAIAEFPQSLVERDTKFIPMIGLRGRVGALKIEGTFNHPLSRAEDEQISASLSQVAVAIERIWLSEENRTATLSAETERMRNALLLSVSHDLRTPLTTIIGSLSTMELPELNGKETSKRELSSIALTEAQRLDRFIENLLDMTRLELGDLKVTLSPVNMDDIIASVIQRARTLLQNHNVSIALDQDLPPVEANFDLLEQAIFNLVDNAGKYCPPPANIHIRAFWDLGNIVIQIMDQGPGISKELSGILFQKFARAPFGDAGQSGTGLGLAITKGFVDAMGGSVSAENRTDQCGAVFTLKLPAVRPPLMNTYADISTSLIPQ
jgi:two-component system, OmpR family, sensor histidine kinase KdpD